MNNLNLIINDILKLNITNGELNNTQYPLYEKHLNKIQIKNLKNKIINKINPNVLKIFDSFDNDYTLIANEFEIPIHNFEYVISTTGLYIQLDKFYIIKNSNINDNINIFKCTGRKRGLNFGPGMLYVNVLDLNEIRLNLNWEKE